jgi:hypothetical protein
MSATAARRQPAVVRISRGVQGLSRNVRQLSSPQSRAAGVSPPWFEHHDDGHNTIATE